MTFRTDRQTLVSDWVVLDAANIAAGPLAVVPLPFRVPLGLHGNWFGSDSRSTADAANRRGNRAVNDGTP